MGGIIDSITGRSARKAKKRARRREAALKAEQDRKDALRAKSDKQRLLADEALAKGGRGSLRRKKKKFGLASLVEVKGKS